MAELRFDESARLPRALPAYANIEPLTIRGSRLIARMPRSLTGAEINNGSSRHAWRTRATTTIAHCLIFIAAQFRH
jgi:hypothetical protein